jgi:hypothetical protein
MLTKGFLEEVEAEMRKGEPVWRETGDGHGVPLIATDAGLAAIGIIIAKAEVGLGLSGLHRQQAIGPDAAMAIAEKVDLRPREREALVAVVDDDEVVARAVHLGEGDNHGLNFVIFERVSSRKSARVQ